MCDPAGGAGGGGGAGAASAAEAIMRQSMIDAEDRRKQLERDAMRDANVQQVAKFDAALAAAAAGASV